MKRLVWALAVLLIFVLSATACATSAPAPAKPAEKTTEAPKPTQNTAPTQAPAKATEPAKSSAEKPPIKIGILQTMTGPQAVGGSDIGPGIALYLASKNNMLAGRNVQLVIEDDQSNPSVALTKVKKLAESDHVNVLIGTNNSGVALAIVDYVIAQKLPFIVTGSGADELTKQKFSPYIFRNGYSNSLIPNVVGDWAYKKGYRKATLLASDYSAGWEWVGGFARSFTDDGGSVVQEQYMPLGAPDPSPFITAVSPDADVMFAFQTGADALRFVPAYEQYGVKKRTALMGVNGLTDSDVLPNEGDSAIGTVVGTPHTPTLDNPANKAFLAAFAQANSSRLPSYHAVFSYEAIMILDKALQAINGNVEDTDALIKAMEKVEIPDSLRGPVKFDQYHQAIMNVYITEAQRLDGQMQNTVIQTYPAVTQFWKWSPEDYLKLPSLIDMKGKWVK